MNEGRGREEHEILWFKRALKSAIKNLEIQVVQLAKQIDENSFGGFGANSEKKIPKKNVRLL